MKILVVDDDDAINQLLSDILSTKYIVTQAYSGTEALRLIAQETFDCVLLDCMLPGLTGIEVIKEAKQISHCPIIIISALTDVSNRVNLLELGADDYITKPFDNREVIARIAVQLRKHTQHCQTESFTIQNLHYDAPSRIITCNNKQLILTLKEQALLLMMLHEPNRVFTKAVLYEAIWQEPYYGDDNTLAVHISRLRTTLKTHDAKIQIETIWGLGYKLILI